MKNIRRPMVVSEIQEHMCNSRLHPVIAKFKFSVKLCRNCAFIDYLS